ncbi:uncharacterized protein LOC135711430 [Ochlerotatus camptorhynchus]|uniref:uncharacterized protein LOC135711430 n=1 Tax=Ochlerotatus camptorhynchus TaxID=644619 RepID=UPI0031D0ACE3
MNVQLIVIFISSAQFVAATDITMSGLKLDPSSDPEFLDMGTLRVTKKSRNLLVVSGTWECFQTMGDEVQFVLSLFSKNRLTGEYSKITEQQSTACKYINSDTLLVPKIREASNIPERGTCPIPKGKFTINNFEAEVPATLPLLPGDYLLTFNAFRDESRELLIGLSSEFSVQK